MSSVKNRRTNSSQLLHVYRPVCSCGGQGSELPRFLLCVLCAQHGSHKAPFLSLSDLLSWLPLVLMDLRPSPLISSLC